MTSFSNESAVSNQVGGRQDVHGPINNGPVLNIYNHHVGGSDRPGSSVAPDHDLNDALGSLAFPRMLDRRSDIEQPHLNTCEWIFGTTEYRTWKQRKQGLLWIKGKPGAGKSTLMSHVYNQMQADRQTANSQGFEDSSIHLNFFYSARGTELQRTPIGMLRSLLNQLMRQHQGVSRTVLELYLDKNRAFGRPIAGNRSWEWQRRELESLLRKCVLNAAEKQQVDIFVDALDEAGDANAKEVAQYLHTINDSAAEASLRARPASLRICISCRHYPVASTNTGLEIRVEDNNEHDITNFIHDRLDLTRRLREDPLNLTPWFELEKETAERARGVFQWARLVVPIIEQCIDDGEAVGDVRNRLRNVPQELADVYEFILRAIIKPANWPQSFKLFQWICFSQRPLTASEMRYAMVAEDDVSLISDQSSRRWDRAPTFIWNDAQLVKRIQACSGGLVEVKESQAERRSASPFSSVSSDTDLSYKSPLQLQRMMNIKLFYEKRPQGTFVQVIHHSVAEFFRFRGLAVLEYLLAQAANRILVPVLESHLEGVIQKSHASLYWSCLIYLCDTSREHSTRLQRLTRSMSPDPHPDYGVSKRLHEDDPYLHHKRYDMHDRQDEMKGLLHELPFLAYAVNNLFVHAEKASPYRVVNSHHILQTELECLGQIHKLWVSFYTLVEPLSSDVVNSGTNLLHALAMVGLDDLISWAFAINYDLNDATHNFDLFGNAPIHLAARFNHIDTAEVLVGHGADINVKTNSLQTPLMIAASNGHLKFVTWLLSQGANLNEALESSQRVLQEASYKGHEDIVRMLLHAGADPNAPGGEFGTALYAAAWNGHLAVAHRLLKAGAAINEQGSLGSALHAASFQGHTRMVQMLIEAGAHVNLISDCFGSALYTASYNGHTDAVQVLINGGAIVNTHGGKFGTALHAAAARAVLYQPEEVVQTRYDAIRVLLHRGAEVDSPGSEYGTPLQTALTLGALAVRPSSARAVTVSVAELFLRAGADVNACLGLWMTPLQAAVYNYDEKLVIFLLKVGAKASAPGIAFGTAMDLAVGNRNMSLALLLEKASGE